MSESAKHQQLVRMIVEQIQDMVGNEFTAFICSDLGHGAIMPPVTNEGYRPDAYYQYKKVLIVGEAKTSEDIERKHSIMQYESYLRKCALFPGDATLIVAVPWLDHARINNILIKLRKKYPGEYSIIILDGIGGLL